MDHQDLIIIVLVILVIYLYFLYYNHLNSCISHLKDLIEQKKQLAELTEQFSAKDLKITELEATLTIEKNKVELLRQKRAKEKNTK
jgi:septal ring factor EnvC (AmiA/AmiB activator)